ncbi:DUF6777 domain-containing protein [Streptomyces sp. NPDC020192]|uniref:DUF6777 domain-containing protein n=1 Tax=Streptomyces sp. NPDC020192 TaxID=3365066 RepID=UPI0037AC6C20
MRIPTGSIVTACVLSAALLVAGCVRPGVKEAPMGVEVYLQPAASQGPEPFTASTATEPLAAARTDGADPTTSPAAGDADPTPNPYPATPPGAGVTVPTGPVPSQPVLPAGVPVVPLGGLHALPGGTPGLYGGTAHVAGCDVERQLGYLTADRDRGEAFAGAAGISVTALPGYLRGLTPVVLRADTRVTGHAYRAGRAAAYQAVLQAGTAILVDDRGVPRVRCACGNPLRPPAPGGGLGARGTAWSGYRPSQVIAVTPAPRAITSITLVNVRTRTWIERRIGHDVRHDHVVPAPAWATVLPEPDPPDTPPTGPPYTRPTGPPPYIPPTGPPPSYTLLPSPQPSTVTMPSAAALPGRRTPPTDGTTRPAAPNTPAPGLALPQNPPSLDLTLDTPDGPDPSYETGPPGPTDEPPGRSGPRSPS